MGRAEKKLHLIQYGRQFTYTVILQVRLTPCQNYMVWYLGIVGHTPDWSARIAGKCNEAQLVSDEEGRVTYDWVTMPNITTPLLPSRCGVHELRKRVTRREHHFMTTSRPVSTAAVVLTETLPRVYPVARALPNPHSPIAKLSTQQRSD